MRTLSLILLATLILSSPLRSASIESFGAAEVSVDGITADVLLDDREVETVSVADSQPSGLRFDDSAVLLRPAATAPGTCCVTCNSLTVCAKSVKMPCGSCDGGSGSQSFLMSQSSAGCKNMPESGRGSWFDNEEAATVP